MQLRRQIFSIFLMPPLKAAEYKAMTHCSDLEKWRHGGQRYRTDPSRPRFSDEVRAIDSVYGVILDLIRKGYEKKEIVEKLDYEKSQSYNKIREAQRKAKEIYDRW